MLQQKFIGILIQNNHYQFPPLPKNENTTIMKVKRRIQTKTNKVQVKTREIKKSSLAERSIDQMCRTISYTDKIK